jgi:hypothetical protein
MRHSAAPLAKIAFYSFIGYTDVMNSNRTRTDSSYFLHAALPENGEGIETSRGDYLHVTYSLHIFWPRKTYDMSIMRILGMFYAVLVSHLNA